MQVGVWRQSRGRLLTWVKGQEGQRRRRPSPGLALALGRGEGGAGPDVGPDCRLMTQSPRGWGCVALGNCMDCISTWFQSLTLNTFYLRFLVSLEDTGEQS